MINIKNFVYYLIYIYISFYSSITFFVPHILTYNSILLNLLHLLFTIIMIIETNNIQKQINGIMQIQINGLNH